MSRFAEANIPVRYWTLSMDKFNGDEVMLKQFKKITENMDQTYKEGSAYRFIGSHGIGKTMTSISILKKALLDKYSALYVTLNDIIHNLLNAKPEHKMAGRNELQSVDFLVIDEFDGRHFGGTDQASDLFARTLEDIVRHRLQNKMPTFFVSNSKESIDSFNGPLKLSLKSLFNYVQDVTALGKDMRKDKL